MATTYTLQVDLDTTQVALMKQSGYSLCLAKKVNNTYNVVWQGVSFLEKNTFQWTEDYSVFGQINFSSGTLVSAATNIVPIQFGQTAEFDSNGVFQSATGPIQGGSFTVNNDYGPINFGVQAIIGGVNAPIYLDPESATTGPETFTPIENVMVWFDRTLTTSTMFTSAVSRTMEIDFTGTTLQTVSYVSDPTSGAGIWISGSPGTGTGLQYVPHKIYQPLTKTFEDLPFANDHTAIRGLLDQYLSSSLGKSANRSPQFLVQATVTLPASGDAKKAVSFLKAYLPQGILAAFTTGADNKSLVAKLAWEPIVQLKELTRGSEDISKLEQIFKSTLGLYGPGYSSFAYAVIGKPVNAENPSISG